MRNKYLLTHEWKIIEDRWDPERHEGSESLFSLGNGYMGQRANFEEDYSGKHLQGSYIAGIYYPDKTRVGWWKNGYPEYFAKVLNAVNWIGIHLEVDGVRIDLNKLKVLHFRRELNMEEGHLLRTFTVEIEEGKTIEVEALRFVSMHRKEIGALRYSISPKGFSPKLKVTPYLDFDVINADSNYDEKFWEGVSENAGSQKAVISAKTKKLDFHVAASMRYELYIGEEHFTLYPEIEKKEKYAANTFELNSEDGKMYTLYKYAAITSSLNHSKDQIISIADKLASDAMRDGFQMLLAEQKKNWKNRWENCDIIIEGDPDAQQGIRFNIFQLTQTYTGEDARLNIGPKGFTGEKYGGSTYWDTEAYCLPFYMSSSGKEVARNLLVYRHNHLPKAIENAQKLGFTNGAALYPMVTMNGEECHNEWEITFEEIHRNGAIAFAIYNYSRYFGDESYIQDMAWKCLLELLVFGHNDSIGVKRSRNL
jgi:maltose phosphorylase